MSSIDILAFGAHPDDVEIGAGGIIAKHADKGYKIVICNLTEAELSSNGTVEQRRKETEKAASILGIEGVINLGIPDRGIDKVYLDRVVESIRLFKPKVILCPHWLDRHPDHVACSQLVREAIFDAAIHKKIVGTLPSHRVSHTSYYYLNDVGTADFIIDISEVYEKKSEALQAYSTQFIRSYGDIDTPINRSGFLEMIQCRDRLWGYQIGVSYGEALVHSSPLAREWLYPF